jgi:hypothetical protein
MDALVILLMPVAVILLASALLFWRRFKSLKASASDVSDAQEDSPTLEEIAARDEERAEIARQVIRRCGGEPSTPP